MCIVCCKVSQVYKNITDIDIHLPLVYVLQELGHKSCFTCFLEFPKVWHSCQGVGKGCTAVPWSKAGSSG